MNRTSNIALGFLILLLGLDACVPSNEPPRFRQVGLVGAFTATDTALPFQGAIVASTGGLHLDFKILGQGVDQTEDFALAGAAPPPATTYWDLTTDAGLRLINRSAPVGSYELVLIAVDGDGITDSLTVPFSVASTGNRYGNWIPFATELLMIADRGVSLEKNRVVSDTAPDAKDATFFLSYQHSSSSSSDLSWMELVPPALLNPALPDAATARSDVRFAIAGKVDTLGTPSEAISYLKSKAPLYEVAGLTRGNTLFFTTQSGMVGRLVVHLVDVDPNYGRVQLIGAIAMPIR